MRGERPPRRQTRQAAGARRRGCIRKIMKSEGVTIHLKATEQYFPVVLFIMLYKVGLSFLVCGGKTSGASIKMKATERHLFCAAVYYHALIPRWFLKINVAIQTKRANYFSVFSLASRGGSGNY